MRVVLMGDPTVDLKVVLRDALKVALRVALKAAR